jgi:hypothetical protein
MTKATKQAILQYRREQREALMRVIDAYAYAGEVPNRLIEELDALDFEIARLSPPVPVRYTEGTRRLWTSREIMMDVETIWSCGQVQATHLRARLAKR